MDLKAKISTLSYEQIGKLASTLNKEGNQYGVYHLTKAQYGIWCAYQIDAGRSSFYNICCSITLLGEVNIEKCLGSIEALHNSHEALTYKFITILHDTYQYIADNAKPNIAYYDFKHIPDGEKELRISKIESDLHFDKFDLTQENGIKYTVIEKTASEIIVYFCVHHIIADGWSIGVIAKDFLSLYLGGKIDHNLHGFSEYIKMYTSGNYAKLMYSNMEYWRKALENTNQLLIDKKVNEDEVDSTGSAEHSEYLIPAKITQKLFVFSKENHLSTQSIILCAFCLVIQRYYMERSLNIGITFARRTSEITRGMVGDLATILPIPFSIDESMTVLSAIKSISESLLDGIEHEDLEIADLISDFVEYRKQDIQPLNQLTFAYHGKNLIAGFVEGQENNINKVSCSFKHLTNNETLGFNGYICVIAQERADGLVLQADYSTKYFSKEMVQVILASITNVVNCFMNNPMEEIANITTSNTHQSILIVDNHEYSKLSKLDEIHANELNKYNGNLAILDSNLNILPVGFPGYLYYKNDGCWFFTGYVSIMDGRAVIDLPEFSRVVKLEYSELNIDSIQSQISINFGVNCLLYFYNNVAIIIYSGSRSLYIEDIKHILMTKHIILLKTNNTLSYLRRYADSIANCLLELDNYECVKQHLFIQLDNSCYIIYESKEYEELSTEELAVLKSKVNGKIQIGKYESIPCYGDTVVSKKISIDNIIFPLEPKRTHSESILYEIWKSLLPESDFSIFDKFYEIGGNSLLIIQLYQKIRERFNINVNIAELFVWNTISEQAGYIDSEFGVSNREEEIVGMKF